MTTIYTYPGGSSPSMPRTVTLSDGRTHRFGRADGDQAFLAIKGCAITEVEPTPARSPEQLLADSITDEIRTVARQLLDLHTQTGIEPQDGWAASIAAFDLWLIDLPDSGLRDGLRTVSRLLALERALRAAGGTWEQVLYIHQQQAANSLPIDDR